jgi:hypothetical protein
MERENYLLCLLVELPQDKQQTPSMFNHKWFLSYIIPMRIASCTALEREFTSSLKYMEAI